MTCTFCSCAILLGQLSLLLPGIPGLTPLLKTTTQVAAIQAVLSMNHPRVSMENIFIFLLWCLSKSRNDRLSSRKAGSP
jgi:hypothetical protein